VRTKRFEGRLFAEDGCLFMVVAVNEAEGSARVTCSVDERPVVLEMPLEEISRRITSSTHLILDNLNSPDAKRRLQEADDGWYFSAREGRVGPYPTEKDAARALGRYVLSKQTDGSARPADAPAGGPANSPRRRSSDQPSVANVTG
jgi:hypothetical protein